MNKVLLFLVISLPFYCMATDVVRYVQSENHADQKSLYYVDVLRKALEVTTDQYGDFKIVPVGYEMDQERTSVALERNQFIDLTWRMTTKSLEQRLEAIYIPLLKGLMGYRIFVIRRGEQSLFPRALELQALKNIPLGQGHNWPDSEILRSNGFAVITGHDPHLYSMLSKGRFDYFPRAIHEPWIELNEQSPYQVEQHFLLHYVAPIYFFVNKTNQRLSARITLGLTRLIDDGTFDKYFYNHPVTNDIFEKSNFSHRKLVHLTNPLLSQKTRAISQDRRLWLNITPLIQPPKTVLNTPKK